MASDVLAVRELAAAAARAVVAQALSVAGDEALCTGDERDRLVDLVGAQLGGTGRFPGGRVAAVLGGLALRLTTQLVLDRWRAPLTTGSVPALEPFVLVVDPAVTDPTRARDGKRPVWAYAHVPNGSSQDPVPMVQARIEQYAPGFTETVVASHGISARDYEAYNPNYVGGDINGGAVTLKQSVLRPAPG